MNTENELNIYFCLYSINNNCLIEGVNNNYLDSPFPYFLKNEIEEYEKYSIQFPFIECFLTEDENNEYSFIKMKYTCPNISEKMEDNSSDKTQLQIHFENECFLILNKYLEDFKMEDTYKGFITKNKESFSEIFVLFNITDCILRKKELVEVELSTDNQVEPPPSTLIKCIFDELFYKMKIFNKKINNVVIDFFKSDNVFSFSKKSSLLNTKQFETPIPNIDTPFQLYLCKKNENGEYVSLRKEEEIVQFEHNTFGMAYYFTTEPIKQTSFLSSTSDSNEKELQRFSVFIINTLYVLNDISKIPYVDDEDDEDEKFSTQEIKENSDGIKKIKNKIFNASSIYFQENGIQFWAIKNNLHFTEI